MIRILCAPQEWVRDIPNGVQISEPTDIYSKSEDGSLYLSGYKWNKSLRIDLDLVPLADTGEFIFFTLSEESDLISNKTGSDDPSDGLF